MVMNGLHQFVNFSTRENNLLDVVLSVVGKFFYSCVMVRFKIYNRRKFWLISDFRIPCLPETDRVFLH